LPNQENLEFSGGKLITYNKQLN